LEYLFSLIARGAFPFVFIPSTDRYADCSMTTPWSPPKGVGNNWSLRTRTRIFASFPLFFSPSACMLEVVLELRSRSLFSFFPAAEQEDKMERCSLLVNHRAALPSSPPPLNPPPPPANSRTNRLYLLYFRLSFFPFFFPLKWV